VGGGRERREGGGLAFKVDDGDIVRSCRGSSDGDGGLATVLTSFVELDRALEGVDAAYAETGEGDGCPGIRGGGDGRSEFSEGDEETCLSECSGRCGWRRCKESVVVFLMPNTGSIGRQSSNGGDLTGMNPVSTSPEMNDSCAASRFRNSMLVWGPTIWYSPSAFLKILNASVLDEPWTMSFAIRGS
jgi:hypothetical protein